MITAITCTGDRPLALELCLRWIKEQTRPVDQWIVIDDGKMPCQPAGMDIDDIYIRRTPQDSDPQHTLGVNIREALQYVAGDRVLFMEDDEYYAPEFVEAMTTRLDRYEIAGICKNRYYHLSGKYYVHSNVGHASLAQTAVRASFLPELKSLIGEDFYIDGRIWEYLNGETGLKWDSRPVPEAGIEIGKRAFLFDDHRTPLYCGIKGLPGRKGLGMGHDIMNRNYIPDKDDQKLKEWVPLHHSTYQRIREAK